MKVFLADLFHYNEGVRNNDALPNNVPLGIGYLAAVINARLPDVDVTLFRYADPLLDALRCSSPDLLGFSLRSWNLDLSKTCLEMAKRNLPDLPMVIGGPSVSSDDDALTKFLARRFPGVYAVAEEGERGILNLISHLDDGGRGSEPIPGVAYLNDEGDLVRGVTERLPLDDIPSPYLTGVLDRFLDEGLVPIIQSMRGCPHRCAFCVSGCWKKSKLRSFPLPRVMDEIDYIHRRETNGDMILADENWGVLRERDVELAEFIMRRNEETGKPSRLYYYTDKIVTEHSKRIVKIISPIAWIGGFFLSYQTLNPDSRKAIRRTNSPISTLREHVEWAENNGIPTVSEMIYGFPLETAATFMNGVETLLKVGVDRVFVFPLQLFPGIELDKTDFRTSYQLETKFRIMDGGHGLYQNGNLFSAEIEEIVVATKWSSIDDYMKVRRYSFFLMMMFGREYALEMVHLGSAAGTSFYGLPRYLASQSWKDSPVMLAIMRNFDRDAGAELHDSRDDARRHAERLALGERSIGALKLNLIYMGEVMANSDAMDGLFGAVEEFIQASFDEADAEVVRAYARDIFPRRVFRLGPDVDSCVTFESRFDYKTWINGNYASAKDLLLDDSIPLVAEISPDAHKRLQTLDPEKSLDLQAFYDETPNRDLLRSIRC